MRLFLIILFLSAFKLSGQTGSVKGVVHSDKGPVPFVNIGITGTKLGTSSDINGKFELTGIPTGEVELIFSAVGFRKKKLNFKIVKGKTVETVVEMEASTAELGEVVISGTLKETYIADSPVKIEVLTHKALKTTPVASVIEAVNMINGVQEQIGCGVCGTNDIHINGMEGPYTLILIDGMPLVSALGSVYGMNGIPTAIVDRIEVIKGPSSTLYGSEAVGGVINIITADPSKVSPAGINSYYTGHGELSADVHFAPKIGKKSRSLVSANYYHNDLRIDDNHDGFTDIPLTERFSLFNKWNFGSKKTAKGSLAARVYAENRFGGVMDWTDEYRGSDSLYGESIKTKRIELYGNYRKRIGKYTVGADLSGSYHNQDSWYGITPFMADQGILYTSLMINYRNGRQDLTTGFTGRLQRDKDNSPAMLNETRIIPGYFIQDEISLSTSLSAMPGFRIDYHKNHGLIFSPRFSVKKKLSTYTTLRLNSGTGFRLVNLFTEDHAALTGSRQILIRENLDPERSINGSLSLNHVFQTKFSTGTFDADVFYTYFSNKIVPDYDVDPNLIVYGNLEGYGISRGLSGSVTQKFEFPLSLRFGFTWQQVFQVDEGGNKETQEFAPVFSGTWLVAYEWEKANLRFDYTGKLTGPQRLPVYPEPFSRDEISDWFSLQHFQITWKKKRLELFTGAKNIFNYTQSSPLISAHDPFGPDFDTSYAWGPLQTRRFFVGLRYNFVRK